MTAEGAATPSILRNVTVTELDRTLDGSGTSDGSVLALSEGLIHAYRTSLELRDPIEDAEYDLASVDLSKVSIDLLTGSVAVVAGGVVYSRSSSGSIDKLQAISLDTTATGFNRVVNGLVLTLAGTHLWKDIEV